MKNKGYEHFYFCLKWLKFVGGGVQFGVRKTIVGHKNNCWFLGVNVEIGDSFPSQKADLYDVVSLKIEQLFIWNQSDSPSCAFWGAGQKSPPPLPAGKNLKCCRE